MPTVLVVDDDDDVRAVTAVALGHVGGWDVVEAASGTEALALAATVAPDAVLLDMVMPDMDGVTAFGLLQQGEVTRHIPVVVLSATVVLRDSAVPWAGLPVAGVVSKPFNPMTLAAEVSRMLGWDAAEPHLVASR